MSNGMIRGALEMNVQTLQHNWFLFSYRCPAQEKSQCPCHWSIWITFGKSYFTGNKMAVL